MTRRAVGLAAALAVAILVSVVVMLLPAPAYAQGLPECGEFTEAGQCNGELPSGLVLACSEAFGPGLDPYPPPCAGLIARVCRTFGARPDLEPPIAASHDCEQGLSGPLTEYFCEAEAPVWHAGVGDIVWVSQSCHYFVFAAGEGGGEGAGSYTGPTAEEFQVLASIVAAFVVLFVGAVGITHGSQLS